MITEAIAEPVSLPCAAGGCVALISEMISMKLPIANAPPMNAVFRPIRPTTTVCKEVNPAQLDETEAYSPQIGSRTEP